MTPWQLFCQQVRYICRKELLAIWKDKAFRQILVVPTLVLGVIFGYTATFNVEDVTYAVLDQSHSEASTSLLATLDGTRFFHRVADLQNTAQLKDPIDREEAMVVLAIPSDFEEKLARGEKAPLQVITDGRNTMTASLASAYTSRVVQQWLEARTGQKPPLSVETRTWFNPNQLTLWYFAPGILGLMSFSQVILLAGMSVAREREEGTFEQLLVTPASPLVLLIGKAFPPVLVGLLQGTMLLLLDLFWFQVPFEGSYLTLYLVLLVYFLSSTGIGLSISSVCSSMQQVQVYTYVYLIPNALLSGVATPVRNMPQFLQILTYADPLRFALDAIRRIYFEGAGLGTIAPDLLPMAVVAVLTLWLAAVLFRKNLG
ncbi:ABC transporter permease [uncultured Acidaminococcus sp.]|uniref:ABC transporter permease n=1 Tax=uncultured Acidaminococcus sp. TaxID=352152 RepID=UPI002803C722|nr:ABC transporter permease [uncultured Acidaminococcus sp.]